MCGFLFATLSSKENRLVILSRSLKKLKLRNFKQFRDQTFDFNDNVNIIVRDNESGKSSVHEAIEIVLNYAFRGPLLSSEFSKSLFNQD